MPSLAFDHIAVPIADAASARELFGTVLGLPLLAAHSGDDWGGKAWLMMIYGLSDSGQVALLALAGDKPAAPRVHELPHYAFAASSRAVLKTWRRRLESAGFAVRDEDHGTQVSVYFEDRGGTTWEITAPPSRNKPDREAASVIDSWLDAHAARRT